MKREDIQEYLDCNGFEALTSFDGTKYYNEETVISIALEVVKNCSIPNVSQRSELLRSYNKFVNEKCLLAGGILSDFEIEKFEERNCG